MQRQNSVNLRQGVRGGAERHTAAWFEQFVRDFVPVAMSAGLDFSRMERVNAKFHGRGGRRREGDVIWRVPTECGGDVYLYLMLEFQSQIDWWMPGPHPSLCRLALAADHR